MDAGGIEGVLDAVPVTVRSIKPRGFDANTGVPGSVHENDCMTWTSRGSALNKSVKELTIENIFVIIYCDRQNYYPRVYDKAKMI